MFRDSCFVKNLKGRSERAKRLAPRPGGPLTHFASPRGEKCRSDSLASDHSRRAYGRTLEEFLVWYPSNASGEGFTRAVLGRYRSHLIERGLSAASVNLALAALRKLAAEATANGGISPPAAAGIRGVPGARRCGVRTGN